ncbi:PQQ-like beta-propeller repeat protein, partial [bacterium]|nr:PQQ-like beta-propeller repeat protein [bacterium]
MKPAAALVFLFSLCSVAVASSGLTSIDTGAYTTTKVRTALRQGRSTIIASSYHGTVLAIGYDGKVRWKNELSGFMNHDIWCEDITGDGNDEILAANADGSVYCLDHAGKLRWTFRANDAPMRSVCVVRKGGVAYVVCGGYDKSFYYLLRSGELVKKIHSGAYSKERTWGKGPKRVPPKGVHTVNFLRRIRAAGGKELLVVHGVVNSNAGAGSLYLFAPLSDMPDSILQLPKGRPCGDMRVRDTDGDGIDEILLGTSSMIQDSAFVTVQPGTGKQHVLAIAEEASLRKKVDRFGYRVLQPEIVRSGGRSKIMLLFGSRIILLGRDVEEAGEAEVLTCRYSFNDMWRDPTTEKIILASSQSGGSCVHVLDTGDPGWKKAYETLTPPGKIAAILRDTETVRSQLATFKKPPGERPPLPVYFMTESIPDSFTGLVDAIHKNHPSPVFLKGQHMGDVENWDRSGMANEKYRKRRDRRKRYTKTGDQIVALLEPHLESHPGVSYWGGHGNDPYMISLATQKKIIDAADGKKVVTIYPELEDPSEDFGFVLNDLIFPLAEYCRGKNANLYIRAKHVFWQTSIYEPMWSRLMTGEFADVFVPSMEETTDKSMELSLATRMGLWASGVVDDWGARCARDNASFDRLRQHSHQMLP